MDEIINLQEDSQDNTPIINPDNYKFSSEFPNITKKETQNDLINAPKEKDDNNFDLINKKEKKRRRKKYDDSERKYQCPDCDKSYLSEPALFTHRKIKHGFVADILQKKNEDKQIIIYRNYLIKYYNFFNDPYRAKGNDEINFEIVKDNFKQIFIQCKSFIFQNIKVIEDYPFYQLVIKNWDKKTYDFPNECLCISDKNVKEEYKTATEKVFTQLFSAEGISDSFNDFFLEFMNPKKYFGLNESELIELAQHFCFWLFQNRYTHSFLSLF